MTKFYSRNVSSSVFLAGILGNFQNTATFIQWGQIFEHQYRVRNLASMQMFPAMAASP